MDELKFQEENIIYTLLHHAKYFPTKYAYIFLKDGKEETDKITFDELNRKANIVAKLLKNKDLSGKRVLLLYPTGIDFIIAFIGCLYSGVIAVPASYPDKINWHRSLTYIQVICEDAAIDTVLTTDELITLSSQPENNSEIIKKLHLINTDLAPSINSKDTSYIYNIKENSITHLQYTSGSTSNPKGVITTHINLLHSLKYTAKLWHYTSNSITVTWAPHTHVYGLVCGLLLPLYMGSTAIIIPTTSVILKPIRWLRAISTYQATHSGCPNFGYEICNKYLKKDTLLGIDLSNWVVAVNGGEPVQAETLHKFYELTKAANFNFDSLCPAYGMSEVTGLIASKVANKPPYLYNIDREALVKNKAISQNGNNSRTLISCGKLIDCLKVTIVDPKTLQSLREGEIGEVWLSGPSCSPGYWSPSFVTTPLNDTRGFYKQDLIKTGDLGFIKGDELFLTGRLKEVIIINGKNYYPLDIEVTAIKAYPDLANYSNAAFSIEQGGEEKLVIIQGIRNYLPHGKYKDILMAIKREVCNTHGIDVYNIVLINNDSIPKTASGKIQRGAAKKCFLNNQFDIINQYSGNRL